MCRPNRTAGHQSPSGQVCVRRTGTASSSPRSSPARSRPASAGHSRPTSSGRPTVSSTAPSAEGGRRRDQAGHPCSLPSRTRGRGRHPATRPRRRRNGTDRMGSRPASASLDRRPIGATGSTARGPRSPHRPRPSARPSAEQTVGAGRPTHRTGRSPQGRDPRGSGTTRPRCRDRATVRSFGLSLRT